MEISLAILSTLFFISLKLIDIKIILKNIRDLLEQIGE